MTDNQKLDKLVEYGVDHGYRHRYDEGFTFIIGGSQVPGSVAYYDGHEKWYLPYQAILFNYDFARALFGDQGHTSERGLEFESCPHCGTDISPEYCFEGYLMQAVTEPTDFRRIDYLYKAVFGSKS